MSDKLVSKIFQGIKGKSLSIMEVCGTHTMAISKFGIRQLLPEDIRLISGPGCPVCVTGIQDIDRMIAIIGKYEVTVFTFGDLIRVPGTYSSLMMEKSKGKDIRVCYSPADAIDFALNNPQRDVLFLSIGFETTAPLSAVLLKRAKKLHLKNFFVYCANKRVIPALEALLSDDRVQIGAFLLPGHVSAVIGTKPYAFIPREFHIPCVISGFEPEDILESIWMLVREGSKKKPVGLLNQYHRVVKFEGNQKALAIMKEVFVEQDCHWRGLGLIPESGLALRAAFAEYDALRRFSIPDILSKENASCRCGDVLRGIIKPDGCALFAKRCRPDDPLGPCMVSSEGSCAAYYQYERNRTR